MFKTKSLKGLLFGSAMALLSAAPALAQDSFVRIGGGLAGTYPLFAAKFAELMNANVPGVRASVVPSDTEPAQIQIENGEMEFNIGYSFVTGKIYNGKGGLGIPTPKARHVITLYGSVLQPLVNPGKMKSLSEINNGRYRVWTGPEGFIFDQMISPALEAHGVTRESIAKNGGVVETMGYAQELQAYQDGNIDVAFFAGGLPLGMLSQVENSPGFDLVPFEEEAMKKVIEALPGVSEAVIPAGTYKNQTEDVRAMYFVNHLVTSADVDEEIVYQATKLMMEKYAEFHGLFPGAEEIDDKDPLANNFLPVHPGAERYYREAGLLK